MVTFKLEKGGKFQVDKGIKSIEIGLGWDADEKTDLDGSVFGLVHLPNGKAKFYGDGSHAVCYANEDIKQKDGSFRTADGSISHSGDSREGGGGDSPDEIITVDFSKLPAEIIELAVFITIYKAHDRGHSFGKVHKSYFRITDKDSPGVPLAQYDLGKEFSSSLSVQVGSFIKGDDGLWTFSAVGAGLPVELGKILEQYS